MKICPKCGIAFGEEFVKKRINKKFISEPVEQKCPNCKKWVEGAAVFL